MAIRTEGSSSKCPVCGDAYNYKVRKGSKAVGASGTTLSEDAGIPEDDIEHEHEGMFYVHRS